MLLEQITEQLTETLKSRVLTLFGHAIDRVILQSPPRLNMGDLATPLCLELAKALKRKPRELAEALARDLPLEKLNAMIRPATLKDVPGLGAEILKGAVKGRIVVKVTGAE